MFRGALPSRAQGLKRLRVSKSFITLLDSNYRLNTDPRILTEHAVEWTEVAQSRFVRLAESIGGHSDLATRSAKLKTCLNSKHQTSSSDEASLDEVGQPGLGILGKDFRRLTAAPSG